MTIENISKVGIRHTTGKPEFAFLLDFRQEDISHLLTNNSLVHPLIKFLTAGYAGGYIDLTKIKDYWELCGCDDAWGPFEGALAGVHKVSGFGRHKYAPRNWQKGLPVSGFYSSALRHLLKVAKGELLDEESGMPNLSHFLWNCFAANWMAENRPIWDDRDNVLEVK